MNVLVANKFYYNRGGDCIAAMSLEKLLKEKGHRVAFFSMYYPQNYHSKWVLYFPSEVRFEGKFSDKLKATRRIFSPDEVKIRFNALVKKFKPDVVHLNNIHSYLSPVIGEIAHRRGIKVVWTLHDYKLVCPSYSCMRDGKPCTLCVDHGISNVLLKKCMKDSFAASLTAFAEALYWNRKRLERNTDTFIAPSAYMKEMMVKGGFDAGKIEVVPNFTGRKYPAADEMAEREDYYCFVGRLSREKGIRTLVEVAETLPYKLVVVGAGPLKHLFETYNNHIEYVGRKHWDRIREIVRRAKFTVIPSEWFENNPISVIESLCLGTPVLGADIGGIPELVNEGNGMLFSPGDREDLREKIRLMFESSFNYDSICADARKRYSADSYYNKIIDIYEK